MNNKRNSSLNKKNSDLREFLIGLGITVLLLFLYYYLKDDPTTSNRTINRLLVFGIATGVLSLVFGVKWVVGLVKKRKEKDENQS